MDRASSLIHLKMKIAMQTSEVSRPSQHLRTKFKTTRQHSQGKYTTQHSSWLRAQLRPKGLSDLGLKCSARPARLKAAAFCENISSSNGAYSTKRGSGDGSGSDSFGSSPVTLARLLDFFSVDAARRQHAPVVGHKGKRETQRAVQPGQLRVVLGRLVNLAKPDKWVLGLAFTFLVAASLAELGIPYLISRCLTAAAEGSAAVAQATFKESVAKLAVLSILYGFFCGWRGFMFSIANQRMVKRLREGTFRALIQQEMGWLDQQNIGELTSRLNSDTNTVANCLGLNLNIMLRNALQALGGGTLLVRLNPQLACVTAAVTLLYLGLSNFYGRYSRRLASAVQDAIASTNQVAEETLTRACNVRVFGAELREIERYTARSLAVYHLRLRSAAAWGLFHGSSSIIFNSTKAVTLLIGGGALASGATTASQLTTFVLYVDMVVSASLAVCEQWASLLETVGASERVMELLARAPAPQLDQGLIPPLESVNGRIVFDNVSFRYPARPEVAALDGVSLTLEAGKVTAFVGGSGSGKSTIAKLVQRLYDPDSGSVTMDGNSLKSLDSVWFRSLLGVVSQEPKLFPCDVATNIAYGSPESTDEEIEEAADLANAHEFIDKLPAKYETPVGEGRLSGGQQQRVAIARALIRHPRLLVLDEATSALDSLSEAKVQATLDRAIHKQTSDPKHRPPTVLVIAHKLATIQNADNIIVMNAGKIVEQGTHAQLLKAEGAYYKLWQQQVDAMHLEFSNVGVDGIDGPEYDMTCA